MNTRWRKEKKFPYAGKSVSLKLRQEKKINNEFEARLKAISLEELFALKLENSYKAVKGRPITNLLNKAVLYQIAIDVFLKFIISVSKTKAQALFLFGSHESNFNKVLEESHTFEYFDDDEEEFEVKLER